MNYLFFIIIINCIYRALYRVQSALEKMRITLDITTTNMAVLVKDGGKQEIRN